MVSEAAGASAAVAAAAAAAAATAAAAAAAAAANALDCAGIDAATEPRHLRRHQPLPPAGCFVVCFSNVNTISSSSMNLNVTYYYY